jgi:two-component system response regulator DesR
MIRVLVAEDMRILRDTLVSVLNLEDDIQVVAQVATGPDIVPAALAERPDIAVLDIDLPGIDGITAAARLHERRRPGRRHPAGRHRRPRRPPPRGHGPAR